MRNDILLALALGTFLGAAAAFAQDNSAATAAATATPAASAPAATDDAIHLHMPVRHHRVAHAPTVAKPAENAAPTETPSIDTIGADSVASPAETAPVKATAESPTPLHAAPPAKAAKSSHAPAQNSAPTIPFSFGEESGMAPASSGPGGNPAPQADASARQTKTASLPPKPVIPKAAPVPAKPVKGAARAKDDGHTGLAKRGAVLFDKGKSNPSPQQFDGLKLLAGELSTALEAGRGPVQLEAYSGTRGDTSSDAHRLSLRRAIAVRQLLIDDGLPSNRIVVRAMGGTDDDGPNDRVDVYVRSS